MLYLLYMIIIPIIVYMYNVLMGIHEAIPITVLLIISTCNNPMYNTVVIIIHVTIQQ